MQRTLHQLSDSGNVWKFIFRRAVPLRWAGVAMVALGLSSAAFAVAPPTLCGPIYPPPLGVSFSPSGNIARGSGSTWVFQNTILANSATVYWGAVANGARLSFDDGQHYSDGTGGTRREIMAYSAGQSSLASGVVVWVGETPHACGDVSTRCTMRVYTGTSGSTPLPLTDAASVGLAANIGGVVPVTSSAMSWHAVILLEAFGPSGSGPALEVFDNYQFYNSGFCAGGFVGDEFEAGFSYTNTSPTITALSNIGTTRNTAVDPVSFTVGDTVTAAGSLAVTASSSNPLVTGALTLGGSGTANRTISFTTGNVLGSSTVSVIANDGGCAYATTTNKFVVTVTNSNPRLDFNQPALVNQGGTVTFTAAELHITDLESSGTGLIYTMNGLPHEGTLKKNGVALLVGNTFTQDDVNNSLITYQHNGLCETLDDFQFGVTDADGGVYNDSGHLSFSGHAIIAQVDHPPVASNGAFSVGLGAAHSGSLVATNPDCVGQAITFSLVNANGGATKGTVVLNNASTGAYTYTATSGESGADSFSFQVSDGGQSAVVAGVISVTIQNQAPVANAGSISTSRNTPVNGTLTASDVDLPAQTLTYSIVTDGTKGHAAVTGPTSGAFTYTPNAGRFGSDTFTFKANDGFADSAPATITVTITAAPLRGDLLVTDQGAARLILVDRVTGDQAVISANGSLQAPRGVAVESSGSILVMDGGTSSPGGGSGGPLVRVDPTTGAQTVVVSAASFGFPVSVAVEASGNILVADARQGLRRFSSAGSLLTTFPAGSLVAPVGVAVAPNGQLFVTDGAPLGGHPPTDSKLVQIDPVTTAQTVLTSGGNLILPTGVALEANGNILVADAAAFFGGPSIVVRVTPAGVQSSLSSGLNLAAPSGVAVNQAGDIFTANAAGSSVVKLAPVGGAQTVVSSGGLLPQPWGIAVVPENAPPVATADAISRVNDTRHAKVLKTVLLANDTDADMDALSITAVGSALPNGATVTLSGGFVVYVAPATNSGDGSFSYTLSDGAGGHTVAGTVTVTEVAPLAPEASGPNSVRSTTSGGDVTVKFIGVPGRGYRVQYSTDSGQSSSWNEFAGPPTFTAPNNGVISYTDHQPPATRQYRLVANP